MRKNQKRIFVIKAGNGMMVHVEEESDVLCGMCMNQRLHKAHEDNMTYTLEWGRPCVQQIFLGLDENGTL